MSLTQLQCKKAKSKTVIINDESFLEDGVRVVYLWVARYIETFTNSNKMTKRKILLLIPLTIISGLLIYSWITILLTNIIATWQHYLALGLYAVLVFLYFKSFTKTLIATGVYLLLATFNAFSMTPGISESWFKIFGIETPHFQPLSLGILILFFI